MQKFSIDPVSGTHAFASVKPISRLIDCPDVPLSTVSERDDQTDFRAVPAEHSNRHFNDASDGCLMTVQCHPSQFADFRSFDSEAFSQFWSGPLTE